MALITKTINVHNKVSLNTNGTDPHLVSAYLSWLIKYAIGAIGLQIGKLLPKTSSEDLQASHISIPTRFLRPNTPHPSLSHAFVRPGTKLGIIASESGPHGVGCLFWLLVFHESSYTFLLV